MLKICEHVAKGGTVREYCKKHRHVAYDTVFNVLSSESGEKYRQAFAQAREIGTHAMAEQCIEIADEKGQDQMRARLRVDTRLRLIGQWNRKIYGPKQDIDLTNKMTLGELVEASMAAAAKRLGASAAAGMIDVTPSQEPAQLAHAPAPEGLMGMHKLAEAVMQPEPAPPRKSRRAASA